VRDIAWVNGGPGMFQRGVSARLVVPAPTEGWLTLTGPLGAGPREVLDEAWRVMAERSLQAARLPALGRAHAVVVPQPERVAPPGQLGIHTGEDCRPSWRPVREVLLEAGIDVASERMCLRGPGSDVLVIELTEVSGG
jgi:hypothetical protein